MNAVDEDDVSRAWAELGGHPSDVPVPRVRQHGHPGGRPLSASTRAVLAEARRKLDGVRKRSAPADPRNLRPVEER